MTISADGKIIGSMENPGGRAVPKLTYTGIVNEKKLDAHYVVTMKDGAVVNSVLGMTKK